MTRLPSRIAFAAAALALALLAAPLVAAETPAATASLVGKTFVGTVVPFGDLGPRVSSFMLRVHLEALTPDADAARLTAILRTQGENGLLNELGGRDLGYVELGTRFPERLQAAFLDEVDGARHLVLITQRPFSARETFRNARSSDYRFRVIELTLDATGNGGGEMLGAARLRLEKDGTLGARSLGIVPWRVIGLRAMAG